VDVGEHVPGVVGITTSAVLPVSTFSPPMTSGDLDPLVLHLVEPAAQLLALVDPGA